MVTAPRTLPETAQARISSAAVTAIRTIPGQCAPIVVTLRRPLIEVAGDWFCAASTTCPVSRSISSVLK